MDSEDVKLRVLIVDDDDGVRGAVSRLLRHHGMLPVQAGRGQRALERLRAGEKFSCVLLDLLLPDMMGCEIVETIATEKLFPLERIIVLTAVTNVANATAYMQFGLNAYIGKPWDNDALLKLIQRVCSGQGPESLEAIV